MCSISVIIPIYNREKCLPRCLDSVVKQTFSDWECILVDDGSTDKSASVCRQYVAADSRFRLYSQCNKGVSSARNKGLEIACGDYIVFIDSDDWISPSSLQRLYESIGKNDLVICGLSEQWLDGRFTKQTFPDTTMRIDISSTSLLIRLYEARILTGPVNKLYVNKLIKEHRISFPEDIPLGEDIIFNFHYLSHIKLVRVIPDLLYHVEKQVGSLSAKPLKERFYYSMRVWKSMCDFFLSDKMLTKESMKFVGIDYCRNVCNSIATVQHLHEQLSLSERRHYIHAILCKADPEWIELYMADSATGFSGWLVKKEQEFWLWFLYECKTMFKSLLQR